MACTLNRTPTLLVGLTAMPCAASSVVPPGGVPVQANNLSHAEVATVQAGSVGLGPELLTHAAITLANVSIVSSPMQLIGGEPEPHCASLGKKLAGSPLEESARSSCAWLAALLNPVMLAVTVPIIWPVASANWAVVHCAATVVNSLMVTNCPAAA